LTSAKTALKELRFGREKMIEYWTYIEKFGVPVLAFLGVVLWGSLFFYLQDCKVLKLMETEIKNKNSLIHFNKPTFIFVGISDIFYSFKNISSIEKSYFTHKKFQEQISVIKSYRKIYSYAFPIIILIVTIGILINEIIIDK
jgi:small-conductance mechanosensitive channel